MKVFRLARRAFATDGPGAYDGSGSQRFPGRWNPKGVRVAYASNSRALATLEYLANVDRDLVPADLAFFGASVPDDAVAALAPSYPASWSDVPVSDTTRELGRSWIAPAVSLAALVPSVIVAEEHNVLINPRHPRFTEILFDEPVDARLDDRLLSTRAATSKRTPTAR